MKKYCFEPEIDDDIHFNLWSVSAEGKYEGEFLYDFGYGVNYDYKERPHYFYYCNDCDLALSDDAYDHLKRAGKELDDYDGIDWTDWACATWKYYGAGMIQQAREWLTEHGFEEGSIEFCLSQDEAEAKAAKWLEAVARIEKFAADACLEEDESDSELMYDTTEVMTERQKKEIAAVYITQIEKSFWLSLYEKVRDFDIYEIRKTSVIMLSGEIEMAKKLFGEHAVDSIIEAVKDKESDEYKKLMKRMNSGLYRYDLEYYLTRTPEIRERCATKKLLQKLNEGCPTEKLLY